MDTTGLCRTSSFSRLGRAARLAGTSVSRFLDTSSFSNLVGIIIWAALVCSIRIVPLEDFDNLEGSESKQGIEENKGEVSKDG
jgi:hypothetical protein